MSTETDSLENQSHGSIVSNVDRSPQHGLTDPCAGTVSSTNVPSISVDGDVPDGVTKIEHNEQQEWTPKLCVGGGWVIEGSGMGWGFSEGQAKAICEAHNAALAAERQRSTAFQEEIMLRGKALEVERQLREQMERDIKIERKVSWSAQKEREQLRERLLSAQAAIAWALDHYTDLNVGICTILKKLREFDLSLLHQHDAEVKQAAEKLCELYFNIAAAAIGEDEVRRKRDEAMANVKAS